MPVHTCTKDGKSGHKWGRSGKCYTGKGSKEKAERQGRAIRSTGWTENAARPERLDPTRTTTLQRRFAQVLRGKYRRLGTRINSLLFKEDAFGLIADSNLLESKPVANLRTLAFVANTRFRFLSSPQKVLAFRLWLEDEFKGILDATDENNTEDAYWRSYINKGYEIGTGRAFDDARKAGLFESGAGSSVRDFYRGSRHEFLRSSFSNPVTVEKVKVLASRTFTDLKGVNDDLSKRLRRHLLDGMVQGVNPREVGKQISKSLGIAQNSATRIARTEIVRAFNEGALDAYEKMGVEEIGIAVEWTTATGACPLCQPMDGVVLRVKDARGKLPRHPNCRCAIVPADSGEFSKKKLTAAVSESVKAEIPKKSKRSVKTQRKKSSWTGANL